MPGTPRAAAALLLLALPLVGCVGPPEPPADAAPGPGPAPAGPGALRVETVAEGLEIPWALAFAPDGALLLTERPGRVRAVVNGTLLEEPVATLPVAPRGEGGLLGLALDPAFAENGLVYVMYTHGAGDLGLLNRISRFTLGGGADDEQVLLEGILGAPVHDGGRLKFGPDGKLYATTGDAANPALAQAEGLNGKVLRLNPDGTIPADNPTPGSAIYTRGHRNPQGLAWDAEGTLYAVEHGPSGSDGPGGFDELNRLAPGANFGWPLRYCDQARAPLDGATDPLACYEEAIAPAGLAWVPAGRYPGWNASLVFGTLRGQHLHRVELASGEVSVDEALLQDRLGRLRDVVVGPDGWLYATTSNRDGRGDPAEGDDRVVRIVPG